MKHLNERYGDVNREKWPQSLPVAWGWLGGNTGRGRRFEGIQFLDEVLPSFRVLLGCKRLIEIGVIGKKVLPE